ncbi:MAG: sigma 54-interacting transcriptional regulator [Candidatus Adiutrix sp.]|nr:sigma 54-interacting transcriptional regulator [Candidatus Adiutrix sp.]
MLGDILVIDDDLSLREMLEMMLRGAGHKVSLADDGLSGLAAAEEGHFDLIISDLKMPGLNGLDLLKRLRAEGLTTPLILVSAFARDDMAVEAMRGGAYDFIPKPFKPHDLLAVVDSALAHQNVEQERQALAEMVRSSQSFGGMVGSSPAMLPVYDLVRRAAQTSTSILVTGESGTGKELVARAVHEHSDRADREFVAINCGGVPENLIESELFDYTKGAFTGAAADKKGLVAVADGGTLFLDELADLTLPMQVKLLRVIQEKTFRPVGGDREEKSDVRFISATNKNLEAEIMGGRFREDLYYRLNVINIHLPALRERPDDIPVLAHFFLEKYSLAQNKDVRKLSAYALNILSRYHFPGNVRELENIIERSVALEQSNIILPESLRLADFKRSGGGVPPSAPLAPPPAAVRSLGEAAELLPGLPPGGLDELMAGLEACYLYQSLLLAKGGRGRAAANLGISPWRLRTRLVAYGLADLNFQELLALGEDRFPRPDLPSALVLDWVDEEVALDEILTTVERHFIREALAVAGGNKTEAASLLGLSRRSFQHRQERTGYEAWAAEAGTSAAVTGTGET